ncbi:hypothetical protein DM02DRAFT_615978 [Periconia macrospinosa]|uniref:Ubiquitin-conjugating enzyme E2-binding protein n=1 Tax=Periconia macrospinosa TaxID=97972 RepID=A0A2V1DJT4_9PLEO|nr:hypothetical protein DM02DRAFT_615978 [Periconia macrospinosa]
MAQPTLPASAYEALDLPQETVKLLTTPKPSSDTSDIAAPNLLQDEGDRPAQEQLAQNETSIVLYAELLLHIRTVTLYASLRTFHTHETKAKLSTDGYAVTVTHEGESATLRMPIQVQGGGDAALSLPAQPPSKELTVRLQIEEKEGTDLLGALQSEERKANIVPWDGASLSTMKDVTVCCRDCQSEVVPAGSIKEWRDLPNENWAEMMDFWHCHKPDEHHLHDHTHESAMGKKGYAAGNRLEAAAGLGFVDLTSFLFKENDCIGAEVSSSREASLVCKKCARILGNTDPSTQGWRIWKWCIGISATTDTETTTPSPTTYPVEKWISAHLLSLAENTGVRKFNVYPESAPPSSSPSATPSSSTTPTPSLLLWLFTPDLFYSSSLPLPPNSNSPPPNQPTRALKIFHQPSTFSVAPLAPGKPEMASIEDVAFPEPLYKELKEALEASEKVLPREAREFRGWRVGLLGRFDVV